jgi:hypothetical protein
MAIVHGQAIAYAKQAGMFLFFILFDFLIERSICLLKIGKDRRVPRAFVRLHVKMGALVLHQTSVAGKYFPICID